LQFLDSTLPCETRQLQLLPISTNSSNSTKDSKTEQTRKEETKQTTDRRMKVMLIAYGRWSRVRQRRRRSH